MRRFLPYLIILTVALAITLFCNRTQTETPSVGPGTPTVERAFADRRSDLWLETTGTVQREIADDNDPPRHQRFILELDSGHTVLVAHNIDLAPRIDSIREGDTVSFYGEFQSNPQGGVIHWTHHDPQGRHPGGWLRHEGKTYE